MEKYIEKYMESYETLFATEIFSQIQKRETKEKEKSMLLTIQLFKYYDCSTCYVTWFDHIDT